MLNQLAQSGEKLAHLDISTPTALANSFLLANSHLSRLIYGTITVSLTSVLAYLYERLTLLNQVSFFNSADPLKRLYIKICGGKKSVDCHRATFAQINGEATGNKRVSEFEFPRSQCDIPIRYWERRLTGWPVAASALASVPGGR